jgi:hypothetical protein
VLVVGAFATLLLLSASLTESLVNLFGPLLMLGVGACSWVILGSGRPQLASQVLIFGVCAVITSIAAFTGGVRSPVMVIYPILILSLGWLSSTRAAIWLAVLIVALTLGLWGAQNLALIPATALPVLPFMHCTAWWLTPWHPFWCSSSPGHTIGVCRTSTNWARS